MAAYTCRFHSDAPSVAHLSDTAGRIASVRVRPVAGRLPASDSARGQIASGAAETLSFARKGPPRMPTGMGHIGALMLKSAVDPL